MNSTCNELLSMVSHDIKSPLNGILGFVNLMADEPDGEVRKKMAGHIEKAGDDIMVLVNNILTLAKTAAGHDKPQFVAVPDLTNEFKEMVQIFGLEAKAKNISLELWMEKNFPVVYWDIERLRLHVFNNIISNALKFTPSGGMVRISVSQKEESICIIIEDSGPGIAPAHEHEIFLPYTQLDGNSHARNQNGHGLGLYNAYRFVESHGGAIRLDPNHAYEFVNENYFEQDHLPGARFIIDIPVIPEHKENRDENY